MKSLVLQNGIVRSYAIVQASDTSTVSFWKFVRDTALARGTMRYRKLPMNALFRMVRYSVVPETWETGLVRLVDFLTLHWRIKAIVVDSIRLTSTRKYIDVMVTSDL